MCAHALAQSVIAQRQVDIVELGCIVKGWDWRSNFLLQMLLVPMLGDAYAYMIYMLAAIVYYLL